MRINIDDVPEDWSALPDDAEIVVSDEDEFMEDSFWENIE